jgi:hypothetical protein
MISCDTNGTSYSLEDDVFTICRDLGAQAALLYSLTSQASFFLFLSPPFLSATDSPSFVGLPNHSRVSHVLREGARRLRYDISASCTHH